jgi:histidinol-phosphatase
MVDPLVNIWDVAPMRVIIPEAGGKITDEEGNPWEEGRHFVASNGKIHDELVATVFG